MEIEFALWASVLGIVASLVPFFTRVSRLNNTESDIRIRIDGQNVTLASLNGIQLDKVIEQLKSDKSSLDRITVTQRQSDPDGG